VNEWDNPADRESNFGLLRNDLSPKPAYMAVQNLIAILREPGANFMPDSLDYVLTVRPVGEYTHTEFVHRLLLEKSNGDFYLLLWHEISDDDTTNRPPREIDPPDMAVTIKLNTSIANATMYSFVDDGTVFSQPIDIMDNSISLNIPDKVVILQLAALRGDVLARGR
jgi:hypothetical protein